MYFILPYSLKKNKKKTNIQLHNKKKPTMKNATNVCETSLIGLYNYSTTSMRLDSKLLFVQTLALFLYLCYGPSTQLCWWLSGLSCRRNIANPPLPKINTDKFCFNYFQCNWTNTILVVILLWIADLPITAFSLMDQLMVSLPPDLTLLVIIGFRL